MFVINCSIIHIFKRNMYKIKIKMQMYTLYSACSLWEPVFQLEERRVGLKEAMLGHFQILVSNLHFSLGSTFIPGGDADEGSCAPTCQTESTSQILVFHFSFLAG